ncbi:MAG: DEAD/DEAH box helicase [Prevotella sp.]|uniref:DEAD/DEAH box helicase n=1 Tax=Prevotella sp. TaxID=59823 RepID=UPI002A2F0D71|nr:DEAD/DEAH box helicase [Prevotella sp.]MDD7319198.1 DEAD/DEAH box helicase [Prevotellaceae bacterium]MDY4020066.1 DEAD/DEAH box helicase [Prevotella sp.]
MDTEKILSKLGIEELNMMQQETAKAILYSPNDVLVLSPTGSGKTLAYLLPITERLKADTDELQAVVIVPGRELALQSQQVLANMGTGLRSMALYGGRPTMDEHRQIVKINPHIIFSTPGRLNDHLDKENVSVQNVEWIVIDEFDKCLEMGFRNEMSKAIERLGNVKRRVLMSATDAEEIPSFVNIRKVSRIDFLTDDEQVPDRVDINIVRSPNKDKLDTLQCLLRSFGDRSTIVFLNFRESVERTEEYLKSLGFSTSAFHGGLEQIEREAALYMFSNGSSNVLVATDLASRGLDIPDVENIVHYHLPLGEDAYIHRVGRTARWDAVGNTYFILGPEEYIPEFVKGTHSELTIPAKLPSPALPKMVTVYIGKGKKDKISKVDIVGFLCQKGGMDKKDIGKIDVKERYCYVAISRRCSRDVLKKTQGEKIKGMKTVVELVK